MDKAESIISEIFGEKVKNANSHITNIMKNWTHILIDKRLADHCRLEDLSLTQLTVSFDHQGWIQVFKMHQRQILNNLNKYTRNSKIISVRMIMKGDVEKYKKTAKPIQQVVHKSNKKADKAAFSDNIENIHDDELKKQLENFKKKLQGN
ncbi:MAG: hypothetical protein B6241_08535 [Spirochaetaceae bacterium 4572_59]|nr:MAG: hypothetical protein B6241_08535 [Spirochaetaceae bacterium 4572_59]